jgi:hypothetical protein
MANVGKLLLLVGELGRHHLRLHAIVSTRGSTVAIFFLVIIIAAIEVGGTLVLLRATMLHALG